MSAPAAAACAHHLGLARIDGDQRFGARAQAFDDGDDASAAPARRARSRRPGAWTRRRCRGCRRPPRPACSPCAMAACVEACRPPSEKLSGVTLTMPMMRGRSSAKPARRARGAVIASRSCAACKRPATPVALDGVAKRDDAAVDARAFARGDLDGGEAQRLAGERQAAPGVLGRVGGRGKQADRAARRSSAAWLRDPKAKRPRGCPRGRI